MQQRPRNDNFRPCIVFGVLPIAHLSTKMCYEAHPSLLGLQRWGPTTLPKMHPVPPLPTPNLNHSNQLQAHRCNVTSTNVASPNNVSPNNVAPKCGVTGKCGVTKQCVSKQCGAKMWRRRKMWHHQTMRRQTMRRQNVASQENVASPNNVAPHVFEMCPHNVSSASVEKCVLFCQHRAFLEFQASTPPESRSTLHQL